MTKSGDADGGERERSRFAQDNRMPEAIMFGLLVVLVLVGILVGGGKKASPPIDEGVRAVIIPTADRARTVVVPPCGTGERITSHNAAAQVDTPGATVLRLPPAERARVVLVPRCSASTGKAGATSVAKVPSAVFVLSGDAKPQPATTATAGHTKIASASQLIVPTASAGRTIVVTPCTGTGRAGQATVLKPRSASATALIAPRC